MPKLRRFERHIAGDVDSSNRLILTEVPISSLCQGSLGVGTGRAAKAFRSP